jgi:uncharacterized protein YukE
VVMTGADAPALRTLAGQMSQSAAMLERTRQDIRSRVYSINWQGQDGAVFRRAWDAQHGPLLTKVAEGLRATADRLLREADQQDVASGAGTGAIGVPPGGVAPGPSRPAPGNPFDPYIKELGSFFKGLGIPIGAASALMGGLLQVYGREISGVTHWAGRHADDLNRAFGPAADRLADLNALKAFGKYLPLVGGVFDGYQQWQDDSASGQQYSTGEQVARAVGAGVVSTAVGVGSEWALVGLGATIGAAGGPPGVLIGAGVGFVLATAGQIAFGDQIRGAGAAAGEFVYHGIEKAGGVIADVASGAVDFGRGALQTGGELLDDAGAALDKAGDALESAGETAKKAWDKITPW